MEVASVKMYLYFPWWRRRQTELVPRLVYSCIRYMSGRVGSVRQSNPCAFGPHATSNIYCSVAKNCDKPLSTAVAYLPRYEPTTVVFGVNIAIKFNQIAPGPYRTICRRSLILYDAQYAPYVCWVNNKEYLLATRCEVQCCQSLTELNS